MVENIPEPRTECPCPRDFRRPAERVRTKSAGAAGAATSIEADIALVAPHAVNWQVKQSVFGEDSEIPTDMIRLLKIVRKSGYSGYLPIETLSPQGKPYDPFKVVPDFLAQLNKAIAETA